MRLAIAGIGKLNNDTQFAVADGVMQKLLQMNVLSAYSIRIVDSPPHPRVIEVGWSKYLPIPSITLSLKLPDLVEENFPVWDTIWDVMCS